MSDFTSPRITEKKYLTIPPTPLTVDGTVDGVITIADTYCFKVGQQVLFKNGPTFLKAKVKRVISKTQLIVINTSDPVTTSNKLDMSSFPAGSTIELQEEKRPVIDLLEIQRQVYEEEPTVALRTHNVDHLGRSYGDDNPVPISLSPNTPGSTPDNPIHTQLSDGSVNIGTVNAELEVQLSRKDNDPNAGDVHDSTRIGNQDVELGFTDLGDGTGEAKTQARTHVEVDQGNSTSTPLLNGASFEGTWTRRTNPTMVMAPASDQNFTYYAQFANSLTDIANGDIDSSIMYTYTAGTIQVPRRLVIAREYYRIVVVNDSGLDMSELRFQTSVGDYPTLASKLNADLALDADADVVRAILAGQQPDGDYVNVRADGAAVDVNGNSVLSTNPLGIGQSYQTGWIDTDGFKAIEITIKSDQVSANNGILIEHTDDANVPVPIVITSTNFTYTEDSVMENGLTILIPPTLDGVRITYTNGPVAQTQFHFEITLRTDPLQSVSIPIKSSLDDSTYAAVVRSVLSAQSPDGIYRNIQADKDGSLNVDVPSELFGKKALSADRDSFGSLSTHGAISDFDVDYSKGILDSLVKIDVTGSGTVNGVGSKAVLDAGTTAGSTVDLQTLSVLRYRPGHENRFLFTASFQDLDITDEMQIGPFDTNDGYAVGVRNNQFGIFHYSGGAEINFISQSIFNKDTLTADPNSQYVREEVPEAIDISKINVFRIRYGWLGSAPTVFEIMSPDGNWVIFHVINNPNASNVVHIENPELPIYARIIKGTNTNSPKLVTASWSAQWLGSHRDSRISEGNSTTIPLLANETFTGKAVELLDTAQINISYTADQDAAIDGVSFQYSNDGVSWFDGAPKFNYSVGQYRTFQLGIFGRFFRVVYTNGPVNQGVFNLTTILLPQQSIQSIHRVESPIGDDRSVNLVKNVPTAKTPDGNYTNTRAQGVHTANSSTTPLNANGIFRGTWFRWSDDYSTLISNISSDVEGTLYIDLSTKENPVDGVDDDVELAVPLPFDPAIDSIARRNTPLQSKWVRHRYVNGNAAQSSFNLTATLTTLDPGDVFITANQLPNKDTLTGLSRSIQTIPNQDNTGFQDVPVDSLTGNPEVTVRNVRDDLLLKPLDTATADQVVVGTTATRLDPSPLVNRREIMISNDGETNASVGFSNSITFDSDSFRLQPGAVRTWSLAESTELWAIAEDTGGTQTTLKRSGSSAAGTATSPSNALTSNDTRSTIDANTETIEIDGFTAGTVNDLVSVKLGIEAQKQSGQTETTAIEQHETGSTTGAGTVATTNPLAGGTDQLYVAYITRNSTTGTITQVQADGTFLTPLVQNVTIDSRRIDVWYAYGNFSAGVVTASMSTSTNAHIAVYRISNANPSTPIQDFGSTTGTGTSVSGPTLNGTNNGYSLLGISHDVASGIAGAGYTEDSDETNGTGSNQDSLATESKALTTTGSEAATYTLIASSSWAAVGVTILPKDANNPEVTVSYEYSAVAGATSEIVEITSTTDTNYLVDITGDRSWIAADISNITAIVTGTNISAAAAEIDHVYVELVDTTGSITRISVVQGGRQLV